MNMNFVAVGQLFRTTRESRLISAEELAIEAGVDVAYIIGLELGWSGLMVDEFMHIARALEITIEQLSSPQYSIPS